MSKHRILTILPKLAQQCSECGCKCNMCCNNSLDLHGEIEQLKSEISKHKSRASQLEVEITETRAKADQDAAKLQDELAKLRERYDRLLDSHKKMQKVNNNLEDKLITVVESLHKEKDELFDNVGILTSKLSDAAALIEELEDRCVRYQTDCNVAVQLLQCRPSEFVAHKLNTLPLDLQERVKAFLTRDERLKLEMSDEDAEATTVRVPMSTFPPTAVYSAPSNQLGGKKHGFDGDFGNTVPMDAIAKALMQNEDPKLPQPSRKMQTCYLCRKHASAYKNVDEQSQTTDPPPPFCENTSVSQQDQPYMGSCPPGVHKASRGLLSSR